MRVARGMTVRSRYRPELFQPGGRRELTERDWLQQPVQLNADHRAKLSMWLPK